MKISKKQLIKLIKEQAQMSSMKIMSNDDLTNQKLFYNMANITRNLHKDNDLKSFASYTLSQLIKKYPNDKYVIRLKKILYIAANADDFNEDLKDYLVT